MRIILLLLGMVFVTIAHGQNLQKKADEILKEGIMLYHLEMASWYGTDIVMEQYQEGMNKVGGYFSYANNHGGYTCLFYSSQNPPKVVATIDFDAAVTLASGKLSTDERPLTELETEYYYLRKAASNVFNNDNEDFFSHYNNTRFNTIPVIDGKTRKVYVLTGPEISGVVLIGNDYLLTFNKNNKLQSKEAIHKSLIQLTYGNETDAEGNPTVGAVHNHLPDKSPFINATDICTLLMYEKYSGWQMHYVISEEYVSLFSLEKRSLIIITRDAWDKIHDDNEKKH